ncbi:MAG: aliphatic sulfonate ABC transporter substrate-binding protein [Rhodopila sp.]|nr:aliphatic sulfonate ABC transporter substrate-binding protein [Rhodopila sp.]
MKLDRRHLLAATLSAPLAALPAIRRARAADGKTLRVGFQKSDPVLMVAKANKRLEALLGPKGYSVVWIEFEFGPPMLEAMRVGSIDIGLVGDTPPVFAQAAHSDLLYIGASRATSQSLLLRAGSKIQTLADLKGKKVAFGRGSSAHEFTLLVLEKAGLRYDHIQPVYLGPADAGVAFERGAVDAWSIWEPYISLFVSRPGVRTLVTNNELGERFSFVMGNGPFVRANAALTSTVLEVLTATAEYARGHHAEVAALLAGATGMPEDLWSRALVKAPFDVLPMNDELTRGQQKIADRFRALGLVPVDIKVSDIVWRAGV